MVSQADGAAPWRLAMYANKKPGTRNGAGFLVGGERKHNVMIPIAAKRTRKKMSTTLTRRRSYGDGSGSGGLHLRHSASNGSYPDKKGRSVDRQPTSPRPAL